MTKRCAPLRSKGEAYKLCRFLVDKKKIPTTKLDTGVPYIDFRRADPNKITFNPKLSIVARTNSRKNISTKGDKKLQAGEIYTYALRLVEKENAKGQASSKTSLSYYLASLKSFRPPWILNDFDTKTTWDKAIVTKIDTQIKKIKKNLIQKGLKSNSYKFNKALTDKLVVFTTTPRSKGGLGVKPDIISPSDVTHERSALAALKSPKVKAHCTELNYILYPVFKMAGLKPTFLLVYRNQSGIVSITHVSVGLRLDPSKPNKITAVDLTSRLKHNWIGTPHRKTIEIPKAIALGLYYNNNGIALYRQYERKLSIPQSIKAKIKALLLKGQRYAPKYPLISYNLATYYRLVDANTRGMLRSIRRALTFFPRYKDALDLKSDVMPSKPKRRALIKTFSIK